MVYQIETGRAWNCISDATGKRADELQSLHPSLTEVMKNTAVRTLQTTWTMDNTDEALQQEPGKDTFCDVLSDMSQTTGIPSLDNTTTVWQANWVLPTIEPGAMLTETGNRLWVRVNLADITGSTTTAMNEKTSLALSGYVSKEEFIQAVQDGDPVFPIVMSAKLARKIRSMEKDDGPASETYVNVNIIDASSQDFTYART